MVYRRGICCKLLHNTMIAATLPERSSRWPTMGRLLDRCASVEAGCNCSLLPGQTCTGYQSPADLSSMTAFQVNIVGPAGGNSTTFTSGGGIIEYAVSDGALTALSSPNPSHPTRPGAQNVAHAGGSYIPARAEGDIAIVGLSRSLGTTPGSHFILEVRVDSQSGTPLRCVISV
jgi:hypothetical protein